MAVNEFAERLLEDSPGNPGIQPVGPVLHLCSDFAKQQIYTQLVSHIARLDIPQVVYAPVRTPAEAVWKPAGLDTVPCYLRHVLSRRHRFMFRSKIRRVSQDLQAQLDISRVRLTHAHFLYSDGAVALALKRRFGTPFIVAVRNTDIHAFMSYRPDLAGIRDTVLADASAVVFLSHAYESKLTGRIPPRLAEQVKAKSTVIPNGVRPAWLAPVPPRTGPMNAVLSLLYVGDFSRNKNLERLLAATAMLGKSRSVRLTLVGGGGPGAARIEGILASGRYPFATYAGRVDDADELRKVYRQHDVLVMPSRRETFGVAYIEALSQGLPVVHSHGQGIDGYFAPSTVAEAADPANTADIAEKINTVAGRLPAIREQCMAEARRFDWGRIASSYVQLYLAAAPGAGDGH